MTGSLTDFQIETLLTSQVIARLGCGQGNELYVVPILFAYDKPYIYSHTREGRKVALMRQQPQVCMEIDQIDSLSNWRSVIIWGQFEELTGNAAEDGLQVLKNRLYPLTTSSYSQSLLDLQAKDVARMEQRAEVIYRIRIERQSGRFEKT
jgi:nitroimidazol reductase NimA-like FMN-containing flavoprotein (pyridoxamine 5'-phosphate oxidase superfamily)